MSWNYFIKSVIHLLPFSESIFILNSAFDQVNKMFRSSPNFSSFCFTEIRQSEGKRAALYGAVWPDFHRFMEAAIRAS